MIRFVESSGAILGAVILVISGLLFFSRQQEPRQIGRLFITDRGEGLQIYRQWRDGTGLFSLTARYTPRIGYGSVAWSPNGDWVAFVDAGIRLVKSNSR